MKTIYKKLLFLLVFFPFSIFAQGTLEGVVLDAKSKQSLPGVNVLIKGTPIGTSTDFDGKFKLPKVNKGDVIIFSYIGYVNQTLTYSSQKTVTISLEEESNQLNEVVIQVGYGSAKKKDATGSVDLVTSKEFNKGAIVSTDQLLAGKAAGVRITNQGGQPDSAPNIRIRGGASLSSSNNPLIVIDGVPISNDNPAGVSNPFSLINPNDVESFSILKDASATAIYGVRASNGVILITTKKGTAGAPQFNYSSNIQVGTIGKTLDVMNAQEYTRFIQEQSQNPNNPFQSIFKTDLLGIDDPNTTALDNPTTPQIEGRILSDTNWLDQIIRTSISTDHNFSARANLYKKIPFRASIGYSNVQGLVKTSDYERLTYSLKMTPKLLNDDLKIDINAKGTYSDKNSIDEGGALGAALSMDPTKPIYGSSFQNKFGGYYQTTYTDPKDTKFNRETIVGSNNPLALLEQRSRPERALRFLGNIEFDYKLPFLKDLRAVLNLGLDASQSRIREVFSNNAIATYRFNQGNDPKTNYVLNPGVNFEENQANTNKNLDAYFVYSKQLSGFVSKFDAQAGYSYQNFVTDGNKKEYIYNIVPGTGIRQLNVPFPTQNPNNRYYSPTNFQAYFARTNVDLLGKYLFTATFRADGTSVFNPDNRWGYFPAAGAAWKLKQESFLQNSKLIQDLKLRVGWGKTGQSNIGDNRFPAILLYQPGTINSQYLEGSTTYTPLSYNPDLTWEKTTTINFGLDFELFDNSVLSGSIDVYQRKTNDLISKVTFNAGETASGDFEKNIGSLDSNGFELSLNVKAISTDDFNLGFNGNVAYNYSTVSNLGDRQTIASSDNVGVGGTGVQTAEHRVGQQPHSAFVFEQVYDASGQPIVGAFKDRNGDGIIGNADRYHVALRPNWTYGFSTNVNYKNWDLTANFRGQLGGQIYNLKKQQLGTVQAGASQDGTFLNNVLDFYNGSGNPLFIDRLSDNDRLSDYWLEDATFLRCDNISLAYKFAKFVGKSSLRVSGAVNNAFIITKYTGQDPENFKGFDETLYPRPRTYTLGLSLDF